MKLFDGKFNSSHSLTATIKVMQYK